MADPVNNYVWTGTVWVPQAGSASGGATVVVSIPSAPNSGQVKIAVTSTAVAFPAATLTQGVAVKANPANAASIVVGPAGITTTADGTGNAALLAPGESTWVSISTLANLFINGTAGDWVSYIGSSDMSAPGFAPATGTKAHTILFTMAAVILDGVSYTSGGPLQVSGSNPWTIILPSTWSPQSGVVFGTGAGSGGSAGANNGTNAAGGGGGATGAYTLSGLTVTFAPGDTLVVSIGAGGAGGTVAGAAAGVGAACTITNSTSATRDPRTGGHPITFPGGGTVVTGSNSIPAQPAGGISTAGAAGGIAWQNTAGGAAGASTGGAGGSVAQTNLQMGATPGAGGGGSGATTAGAGGIITGLLWMISSGAFPAVMNMVAAAASGNLAGGGWGAPTPFGYPGAPGGGGAGAGAGTNYGFGGSGGGGNGAGAKGGDGCVFITGAF